MIMVARRAKFKLNPLLATVFIVRLFSAAFSVAQANSDYEDPDVILCSKDNSTLKNAPFMTPAQFNENSMIASRSFAEDRQVLFPVKFTYGCPLPNLGQWYKNGLPLDPEKDPRLSVDLPSFRLKLKKARMNDTGLYRFAVRNTEGELEFTFALAITGAPFWCPSKEGHPVTNPECNCLWYDYEIGNNLMLTCNLCEHGNPIQPEWFMGRDGDNEDLKPVKRFNTDTRILITETANISMLTLQFLKQFDDGLVFECRASNKIAPFSFRWVLRHQSNAQAIISPPLILSTQNGTAAVGGTSRVICNLVITGEENWDEVIWLRGDWMKLLQAKNFTNSTVNRNAAVNLIPKFVATYPEYRENVTGNVQELVFNPVRDEDFGPHTCYFTNNAGAAARVVHLLRSAAKPSTDSPVDNKLAIGLSVAFGICFIVGVIVAVLLIRRRYIAFKPVKKRIIFMNNNEFYDLDRIRDQDVRIEVISNRTRGAHPVTSSVARSRYEIEVDPRWELPRNKIIFGDPIGDGNIGCVRSGRLLDHYGEKSRDVAIKMLRDDATDDDLMQLIKEISLLKQVGSHANVINFFGCCTQNGPVLVVVELARFGNLRDFLRHHRPPEPESDYILPSSPMRVMSIMSESSSYSSENAEMQLMFDDNLTLTYRHLAEFAQQIAKGMEYLSSRGCIHRDLAARNVLVSDNYQMKVSDFGLTRRVENISTDYYRRGNAAARLPLKWMAIESLLDSKYTTKSDVWSYGILLWEIYSLGENPYRDLSGFEEIVGFIVDQKRRLERPKYAEPELYESLFKICWRENPDERPSFQQIRQMLEEYGQKAVNVPLGSIPNAQSPPMSPNGPSGNGFSTNQNNNQNNGPRVNVSFSRQYPSNGRLPSVSELDDYGDGGHDDDRPCDISQVNLDEDDSGESGHSTTTDEMLSSNGPESPGVMTSTDSQYSSMVIGNNSQQFGAFSSIASLQPSSSPQHPQRFLPLSNHQRAPPNHYQQRPTKRRIGSASSEITVLPVLTQQPNEGCLETIA